MNKGKKKNVKKEEKKVKGEGQHINALEHRLHRLESRSVAKVNPHSAGHAIYSNGARNAQCWVNSIFHPFGGACHFPETLCEGTDVSTLSRLGSVNTATGFGAVSITSVVYTPSLKGYIWYASAATTLSNITYSSFDHPKKLSLESIVGGYRVTSMGVRIRNVSSLLNRNGRLFVGRLPPKTTALPPIVDLYDLITYSTEVKTYDLATLPEDGVQLYWIPLTTQGYVNTRTHSSSSQSSFTALGFKSPEADVLDNRIFFMSISDSGAPAIIVTDEVLNIEFIPHIEDEYLFEPKAVMGSQDQVEQSFSRVVETAAKEGLSDVIRTGVYDLGREALSGLKSFGKMIFSPSKQLKSEAIGGGLFSGLLSSRRLHPDADILHIDGKPERKSPHPPSSPSGTSLNRPRLPRRRGSVILSQDSDDLGYDILSPSHSRSDASASLSNRPVRA